LATGCADNFCYSAKLQRVGKLLNHNGRMLLASAVVSGLISHGTSGAPDSGRVRSDRITPRSRREINTHARLMIN
jgi:hypothetical protein